jgi:DNA polymerase-3 subunit gamma/tau
MGNLAYYLKYRPQTLQELIGQESVKKTLLTSFQNNKLSHAYLFVGPRGTGKTSTARILAKMVNCSAKQDVPCNECHVCLSITDGSNMDLIEIDAASNRGIEDIRSLRDRIKLSPTSLKKKVYIIDEAHMLTTEAFNALLKTLEEPPEHALFILATTEAAKIPQTILSRVQKLDFKLATQEEIAQALGRVIKEEKIDIEEDALKFLIRRAEGSFRDAVKLLDQVSSDKSKITAKSLGENLKSTHFDDLVVLIRNLSEHNAAESLLNITKQLENGIDTKALILSLTDLLRNLMFIKNGLGEQLVESQFIEDKYKQLVALGMGFSEGDLIRALDILQKATEKLKFASIPPLPLELAVVEICDKNSKAEKQPQVVKQEQVQKIVQPETEETETIEIAQAPGDIRDSSDVPDILRLREKWTFVLETVRSVNFSLEALLRSVNITECTDKVLVLEVPYSFHQRILDAPKNRDLLEGVFSDILGRPIRISTALGSRPQRREDIANIELAADDEIIRAAAEIFNSDPVN